MMRSETPSTMRTSVLVRAGELTVENRPVPAPQADQVIVRVNAVGICGSDVHYFHEGRIGDFIVEAPLVLGHEAGGVIVAVGEDVEASRIGERVSIEPVAGTTSANASSSTRPRRSTAPSPSTSRSSRTSRTRCPTRSATRPQR